MIEFVSHSVAQTEAFARDIAARLRPGDVLALTGDLGAGKTAFVRGLAAGLSIEDRVTSPTFVIMNEYHGRAGKRLCHFDMYRVGGEEDLETTGYYDMLGSDAVLAIEWSERVAYALPLNVIRVEMATRDAHTRTITVTGDERF